MLSTLFTQGSEKIQYLGTCYTQDCLEALGFILQTQQNIEKAILLSNKQYHAFLIISERHKNETPRIKGMACCGHATILPPIYKMAKMSFPNFKPQWAWGSTCQTGSLAEMN